MERLQDKPGIHFDDINFFIDLRRDLSLVRNGDLFEPDKYEGEIRKKIPGELPLQLKKLYTLCIRVEAKANRKKSQSETLRTAKQRKAASAAHAELESYYNLLIGLFWHEVRRQFDLFGIEEADLEVSEDYGLVIVGSDEEEDED